MVWEGNVHLNWSFWLTLTFRKHTQLFTLLSNDLSYIHVVYAGVPISIIMDISSPLGGGVTGLLIWNESMTHQTAALWTYDVVYTAPT